MTSTAPEALEGPHPVAPTVAEPAPPSSWERRLRHFGYRPGRGTGRAFGRRAVDPLAVGLRERLDPPYTRPSPRVWSLLGVPPHLAERLWRAAAWTGPLLVALLAGVLRFWNLGKPHAVIFDETYYAKDSWALINQGYEGAWPKDIDKSILTDPGSVLVPTDPGYVVHPPVGKWIIGIGEKLFGFEPFGWRFMVALLGTLSVLMLCRIGRRLFRSTFLGCLAGLLLAVDGLHFVMSRTALLDQVLMFFVLAAFGCLVVDRDRARARLIAGLPTDPDGETGPGGKPLLRPDAAVAATLGLGWRPWRLAAGVMLGLAAGTKWNGLYIMAAFGLMAVLWDVAARRMAGAVRPYATVARRDLIPAFVSVVPVAVATYVASWTGWILTDRGYFRHWAAEQDRVTGGGTWSWLPEWLRSLWHYETEVYKFHVGLSTPHTYESNPWSWIVLGRPVSYFYESPSPGTAGCPADAKEKCAQEVLALGTPLLWWAACFAILYVLWRWVFRRDWRAGAIACGIAAGWAPWFLYQERTIFLFYAVVFVPFLCLAVAMMLGAMVGPAGSSERRRTFGAVAAGVLVLLIVWNFIYFWPLYTGQAIPIDAWRNRMWLDTWV
ncbi:dolichyl-phosphate-mannose--protein mannosyltransferase [Streptomyces sp. NPDC090025]|uniref:dolichyl-phosphate-mannose--protein mannosyltransferase n=1 Tax=Streptomyces sp. NPDC090025 TaxID=3365922 RepID=UPI003834FCEE